MGAFLGEATCTPTLIVAPQEALYRRPRTTEPEPRATRSTRICCAGWRSRARTRWGRWTSPTSQWRAASSIWLSCLVTRGEEGPRRHLIAGAVVALLCPRRRGGCFATRMALHLAKGYWSRAFLRNHEDNCCPILIGEADFNPRTGVWVGLSFAQLVSKDLSPRSVQVPS